MKRQSLPTLEEAYTGTLFGAPAQDEHIVEVDPSQLIEIEDQPFRVYASDKLSDLASSIAENGQQQPCIVRKKDGQLLILAGRNRKRACELAGVKVKCIIRTCSDAEADLILTDTNLYQRHKLLPSELALAYKMQKEAYENRGERKSTKAIAEAYGENVKTVQRYIKLADLNYGLLMMVDQDRIPVHAGIALTALPASDQYLLKRYLDLHPDQEVPGKAAESIVANAYALDPDKLSHIFAGRADRFENDMDPSCLKKSTASREVRQFVAPARPLAKTDVLSAARPVPRPRAGKVSLINGDKPTAAPLIQQFDIGGTPVAQIQLPSPDDQDPHPRLLFQGGGIHAGDTFIAWLPDGWHEITLEVSWNDAGPNCWYICDPALRNICPVGLWCCKKG